MNNVFKSAVVVMIMTAGVLLGACAPEVATTNEPVATGTPRPLPSPEAIADTTTPEPEPSTPEPGVKAFGQPFTYEDGLKVTVSKPVKVKRPSYYSTWEEMDIADPDAVYLLKFTVVVENTGPTTVDPSMATLIVVSGEAGNEADSHCWSEVVTCGTNQSSLRTGRKVTMSWWFVVPRAEAGLLTAEFSPSFEHEDAVFEGAFK
jgi:hypothetical protein